MTDSYRTKKQPDASAAQALTGYTRPGNVRERYNWMERPVALYPQGKITRDNILEELSLKSFPMATITLAMQGNGFRVLIESVLRSPGHPSRQGKPVSVGSGICFTHLSESLISHPPPMDL